MIGTDWYSGTADGCIGSLLRRVSIGRNARVMMAIRTIFEKLGERGNNLLGEYAVKFVRTACRRLNLT